MNIKTFKGHKRLYYDARKKIWFTDEGQKKKTVTGCGSPHSSSSSSSFLMSTPEFSDDDCNDEHDDDSTDVVQFSESRSQQSTPSCQTPCVITG